MQSIAFGRKKEISLKTILFWFGLALLAGVAANAAELSAQTLLQQATAAQGGEQQLRSIHSIAWRASGYRNAVEQSERPEGPYVTEFAELAEIHDGPRHRSWRQLETRIAPLPNSINTMVVADQMGMALRNGRAVPATAQQVLQEFERIALSPEHLLLSALAAPDLRRQADTPLHGVVHQVLEFSLDSAPVRIFLNSHTHLPSAVEYSGPLARAGYAAFLGDAVQRTYFSFWQMGKDGLRFPMQWNVQTNGLEDRVWMLRELKINQPLDDQLFAMPAEVGDKYRSPASINAAAEPPLGKPAPDLAPGIVLLEGAWNASIVLQDEGVLIIEAPISSAYSAKVIAEARRLHPGKPIVGMVTTSDSWPHLAGVREYVAQGIPVYALDLNAPILRRVLAAPYATRPDKQQREPSDPQLRLLHDRSVIGSGTNRVELYPLRGMTSERQLMVYFPEHKLLYGSDAFQKSRDGNYFSPQTVSELMQAVARENLVVDHFYMMHMGVAPWTDLRAVRGSVW